MLKAELRQQMLIRRQALTEPEVERRSRALEHYLFREFPVAQWQWLHVFLPIPHRHEPNTWHIIRQLWQRMPSVQVAVPLVQPDGQTLRHYHLQPSTALVENRWGIPEPVGAAEVLPAQLDAVLVPLLAVDEQGHRVGYGKGFYDRFLEQCRPHTLRIGLSLEPPVRVIADAWPGDVRLHACLTPEAVWQF